MKIADHLPKPADKGNWSKATREQRMCWSSACRVSHPVWTRVIEDAIQKVALCKMTRRCDGMLVLGGSGAGKTTLTDALSLIAAKLYGFEDRERTICPVLQLNMPDPCTPTQICIAILEALGDDAAGTGTKMEIFSRAKRMLKACEVRVVLVDNFHDTPTKRGPHGMKLAGARIRDLMDSSEALWIFLGTEDARRVRNSDPQLIKRIPYQSTLNYFSIASRDQASIFKRLLSEIDKWLPFDEPSCLLTLGMPGKFHTATGGIFDRIIRLIEAACVEAIQRSAPTIDVQDLESAFRLLYGPDLSANPFSQDFVLRKLDQPGEPFEILK